MASLYGTRDDVIRDGIMFGPLTSFLAHWHYCRVSRRDMSMTRYLCISKYMSSYVSHMSLLWDTCICHIHYTSICIYMCIHKIYHIYTYPDIHLQPICKSREIRMIRTCICHIHLYNVSHKTKIFSFSCFFWVIWHHFRVSFVSFDIIFVSLLCHLALLRDVRCINEYRVAKTHRIPYLYRSFSAKVTYI